jgi:hypothetical protein
MDSSINFEILDTSYVSLAALIRYLREREFSGRVHIDLAQYEADVIMDGASVPSAWERDLSSGREAEGDEAMQRLLVRAREPGGLITLYKKLPAAEAGGLKDLGASADSPSGVTGSDNGADTVQPGRPEEPTAEDHWSILLAASSELIAAIERALQSTGVGFAQQFRTRRIELGDDYPFLDPTLDDFKYKNSAVQMRARPDTAVYVNGLSECLKRVVNGAAAQGGGSRLRERVVDEIAAVTQQKPEGLAEFNRQLDRIAGTKEL